MDYLKKKIHDPETYIAVVAAMFALILMLLGVLVGCTPQAPQIGGDAAAPPQVVIVEGSGAAIPEFEVLALSGEGEFTFSVMGQVMHVGVEATTNRTESGGPCAVVEFRWTLIHLTTDFPRNCSVAAASPVPPATPPPASAGADTTP